jgi:nickel-dependent lactate racemase
VNFVASLTTAYTANPVDIVVTSGGGHPLDLTFYQAIKGMVGAIPILKPGGTIIIASHCAEGIGNPHFANALLGLENPCDFVATIQSPSWQFVPDQWQIEEFSRALRAGSISMVCDGIEPEVLKRLHVDPSPKLQQAIDRAIERHGHDASIAVIPCGPYVIAKLRNS